MLAVIRVLTASFARNEAKIEVSEALIRSEAADECIGGDKRPIFWNRTNLKSLDVAQVGDTLYYFSAGFLTSNRVN